MLTGKNAQSFGKLPFGKLPPDRRKGGFSFARSVGAQVPKLTRKAFEKFGFHTAEILTDWARIAGSDVAAWTAPERIRWPRISGEAESGGESRPGGTLTLRVEPARALDIEYRAAEIIDRINRYFGYRAVATLKLIQAPLDRSTSPSPRVGGPTSPPPLWGRPGGGEPVTEMSGIPPTTLSAIPPTTLSGIPPTTLSGIPPTTLSGIPPTPSPSPRRCGASLRDEGGGGYLSNLPTPLPVDAALEPGLSQALARLWESVSKAARR